MPALNEKTLLSAALDHEYNHGCAAPYGEWPLWAKDAYELLYGKHPSAKE